MTFAERRKRLFDAMPAYSMAILQSGHAQDSVGDEQYPFEVERSFYYLTDLNNDDLTLLLVKTDKFEKEIMFIETFDETMAKWFGGRIKKDEVKERTGIEDIRYNPDLWDVIYGYLKSYGVYHKFTIFADLTKQEFTQESNVEEIVNRIKKHQPDVIIENLHYQLLMMRYSKDEEEIAKMRKALDVTRQGIETMMRYSHENIWENELEAYFDYVLKCNQCEHAFTSIVAAGKNATVLHYRANNQYAKENELVLVDLGASYKKYCADITRTFPTNGHFTERQKVIYDIVLRANKLVASLAKPGVTTRWLNEQLLQFYEVELKNIGLLEDGKTVRDYYWHGVSHSLGLETHDIWAVDLPLAEGCVITDEPGLYLEDEGIGIRIEDDLYITKDGCEVLSKDIIKEIDEIENFMNPQE